MLPQGNNQKIEGKVKLVFFGKVLYEQLRYNNYLYLKVGWGFICVLNIVGLHSPCRTEESGVVR